MYIQRCSLLHLLALLCISNLTIALTPWESIHQTINLFALAVDFKDFALLSKVFTTDAFANFGAGSITNVTGLSEIETGLAASLANHTNQHQLGTTVIDIHQDGITANATTYFVSAAFGIPYYVGSVAYIYGYYNDTIKKTHEGWRISFRKLVFQGPGVVGNLSVVGL